MYTPCPDGWYCQADGFCNEGCTITGCEDDALCDEDTLLCTSACVDDAECSEPFPECNDELVEPGEQALCVPCVDLGQEPNDVMEEAVPLGDLMEGILVEGQRLCGPESDWYSFEVTEAASLSLTVFVDEGDPRNLGVEVLAVDGITVVFEAPLGESGAPLAIALPDLGQYFLRFFQDAAFLGDQMIRTGYDFALSQRTACTNDSMEPNPGPRAAPTVAPALYEDLVLCADDEDWYAVELEAGTSVLVELGFSNVEGNLDLHLVGPDGVVPVATAESETDGETIAHPVTSAGVYFVRVFSSNVLTETSYSLNIMVSDISCTADRLEPNPSDSSATDAVFDDDDRYVEEGLTLCQADEDWYVISPSHGQLVLAEIAFAHDSGDLQFELVDPEGYVLASSTSFTDNEYLRFTVNRSGEYFLRVYGATPYVANSYNLVVELGGEACAPDALEPNDASLEPAELTLDTDYEDLTLCVGEEDWYQVDASDGQIITVETNFDTSLYDIGVVLYLLRRDGSLTWLAGSDTISSRESIVYQTFDTGTYLVRVYRSRGTLNAVYDLNVNVTGSPCVRDELEPNNTYLDATEVASGDAFSDLSLCVADVDWYQIELRNGQLLTASIDFIHTENDLGLRLYKLNSDGTITYRAGSDTLTNDETILYSAYEDGTFLVFVYRSRGTTTASYDFSIEVTGTACESDALEPNDSSVEAMAIEPGTAYLGLTLCAGDSDWFSFDASNGQLLTLEIDFSHDLGDLGMRLYKLNDDGTLTSRDSSDTLNDDERISYRPFESGTFVVNVYRSRGALTGAYSLNVDVEGEACVDDDHEPNNSPAEGAAIVTGDYPGQTLCIGDEDWYQFDVGNGQLVDLSIAFSQAESDLGLALYRLNSDGTITYRAGADTLTDNESIRYRSFDEGTYVARVYRSRGAASMANYDLSLAVEGSPCDGDDFEPNNSSSEATAVAEGSYPGLTLCVSDDDWYSLEVGNGQLVNVAIDFSHAASDLGLRLYRLNDDGTITSRASADTLTDDESIRYRSWEDGTFLIQVYRSRGAVIATYDLSVAVEGDPCVEDEFEPNNASSEAEAITQGDYLGLTLCAGDEDWYSFEILNGQVSTIRLDFVHALNDLGVQLYRLMPDGTTTYVVGADTTTDGENVVFTAWVDATYLLRVYRSRGTSVATYDLSVSIAGERCVADDFEPNDHWLDASEIVLGTTYEDLTLCVTDNDYYTLDLTAGQVLTAQIDFIHADNDLGFYLYRLNADGTITAVRGSDTLTDNEIIVQSITETGTYILRAYLSRGSVTGVYDMSTSVTGP
jgi:transcription initiation factor IIE alpha subunit/uncharacterized protein YneR